MTERGDFATDFVVIKWILRKYFEKNSQIQQFC